MGDFPEGAEDQKIERVTLARSYRAGRSISTRSGSRDVLCDRAAVLLGGALTAKKRCFLVRQYRPAIQRFSLELPAGLREGNEDPMVAIAREIKEETGYLCRSIQQIGEAASCSSRIENVTLSFFVEVGDRIPRSWRSLT
jgi:8-oxo-dGTP pyrophosphatase MutT (NUDIX family)